MKFELVTPKNNIFSLFNNNFLDFKENNRIENYFKSRIMFLIDFKLFLFDNIFLLEKAVYIIELFDLKNFIIIP